MKPVVIQVFGDKTRKLEPEHHRIEFPGGYVTVDRTSDGKYWAHIGVLGADEFPDTAQGQAIGNVVGSRVDFNHAEYKRRCEAGESPIPDIDGMEDARHFAVCIEPKWR